MTQGHILIVEDEPDLASLLDDYLQANGYSTHVIHKGGEVMAYFDSNSVDLILLDIQLPQINGLDLCKLIREKSQVPVVFVTARVEEIDRILGLEVGADDYICKPFSPKEVVARVKTIMRRIQRTEITTNNEQAIVLDEDRLHLTILGNTIELTKTEANLFGLLFNEPGKIFSRDKILAKIYSDYRVVSARTVDSHIKKLRKKITDVYSNSEIIVSIYGAGYKYEPITS